MEYKMTKAAYVDALSVWDVKTLEISQTTIKGSSPENNRECIIIRINPMGSILSDVEINLYSKGNSFPEENITIKKGLKK
jgi:hypothetical protein|tara:strand:- start:158 stop:397 length:240 start_codon:yes stop_codon:yes gene_type:complete